MINAVSHLIYMKKISLLFVLLVVILSCKKTDTEILGETRAVNYWVLSIMQNFYLWEQYLPTNLSPAEEPDTKNYFDKLLYKDDQWSYITDDYDGLINALDGIYKDFGFSYSLTYMYPESRNSNNVIGVVEYVLEDSPAGNANIKRGDVFNKVNGVQLTTENYRSLLDPDLYRLGFIESVENSNYKEIPGEVVISAVVLEEDPILTYSVLQAGGKKVAYLMYNAFIYSASDSAKLVNVFQYFKDEQVSELVLDLRYNGGGATNMATMLASMIVGENYMKNNDLFYSYVYNEAFHDYFENTEGSESTNLKVRFIEMPVNLNLSSLYVLSLEGTASASELIINGLDPFLNVVQIGDVTYGKYTASIPIQKREPPGETWGMLPIIAKTININGVTDYSEGLTPDFFASDDYSHPLGDQNEELLNVALSYIDGTIFPQNKSVPIKQPISLDRLGGNALLSKGLMIKK